MPASLAAPLPAEPVTAAPIDVRRLGQAVGLQVVLFLALLTGAFVAMRLIALPPTHVTVIWLPAGIALLALRTPFAAASVVTIALAHWAIIALANDYAFLSWHPWSLLMAAANTAGPVIGAGLWRRWSPVQPFADNWSFLRWVFGVAMLPALLTAWVIPAVIYFSGHLPHATWLGLVTRIGSITLSSVLGVFLFVPLVIAPWRGGLVQGPVQHLAAQVANASLALLVALIGFHLTPAGLYFAIPLALISAIVCGPRGLGIGLFIFIGYGLLATAQGVGPFAAATSNPVTSLFEMSAAALCLGIPAHFAGLTLNQLHRHGTELEEIIAERTRELRASEERFRLATHAVAEGIFEWHGGNITADFDEDMRRRLGPAMVTRGFRWHAVWRLVHPEDRPALRRPLREFTFGSADVFSLDGRLRLRSGEWAWFRVRGKVIARDERGRARRVVGTFTDATAEIKQLHDLAAEREQAVSQGRAKDQFLAMMGHEIRTPMHAMLGFARILDSTPLEARQRECVDAILSSGDLLLGLLNDMLDLSRIEANAVRLEVAPTPIRETVEHTMRIFESEARRKHLQFGVEVDPQLPELLGCDRLRVHQVLANLISNAIKFTEQGSVRISVSGEVVAPATGDPADDSAPRWRVVLEVFDTGIGIAPGQIDRIFNPYAQADETITRRFGGTGLGLAISRRLCELMGGTIRITSKAGRGSIFSASFVAQECAPLEAPPPDNPGTKSATPSGLASAASVRVPRVLVVENNRLNRRLAAMMLQKLGYTAEFAENGAAALERVEAESFDLVLMDLQMPVMDGLTATRAIRTLEASRGPTAATALRPRLPIVALTANAGSEERARCLDAGMDDYLTKPLDLATFRETMERVLHQPSARFPT